ncbi:electron transfer flavoprotein subunit beta/FixA family protein [Thermodesulfobacteriota bacterium]
MNILVLVKHAFVSNVPIRIDADGKGFKMQDMAFEMNDWDRYALEEAVNIKEQKGGEIVVISVGEDCERTLRAGLAMGADRGIKILFDSMDSRQIAEAIREGIKTEQFDIILAGFQSQDLNNALVGPILASMLDLPYATGVTSVKLEDEGIRITRELEGGFEEEDTLQLPCLLTVQTGINKPRYASFKGIKKAKKKEVKELSFTPDSSTLDIKKVYFPEMKRGTMIEGSPEEIGSRLIEVLKEREVL